MTGRIVSINVSVERRVPKTPVAWAEFRPDLGVVGDAHAGPGDRQVSLMAVEAMEAQERAFRENPVDGEALACPKSDELVPGALSENLTTEGLALSALPVGARLQVGDDVVLEITMVGRECYHYCDICTRMGHCAMPPDTAFARVARGGVIRSNDPVQIRKRREHHAR